MGRGRADPAHPYPSQRLHQGAAVRQVEKLATELLGDRLVRMWAQPVTSFDQRSTKALMEGLAPA